MSALTIEGYVLVADTPSWRILAARMGDRWVPAALGALESGRSFLNVLPTPGPEVGMESLEAAVRLASAYAQDEAQGLGPVVRWYLAAGRRAGPEEYRCARCHQLDCFGECGEDDWPLED